MKCFINRGADCRAACAAYMSPAEEGTLVAFPCAIISTMIGISESLDGINERVKENTAAIDNLITSIDSIDWRHGE